MIARCDKNPRRGSAEGIVALFQATVRDLIGPIPRIVVPYKDEDLEWIYSHPQTGALYTAMYVEVAGSPDKIRELKGREYKQLQANLGVAGWCQNLLGVMWGYAIFALP